MSKRRDSRKNVKRDKTGSPEVALNGRALQAAVRWIASERLFHKLKPHGNTSWCSADLVMLAVAWTWAGHSTLTGAFAEAHHWCTSVAGRAAVSTYQGLLNALVTWTATFLPLLRCRMQTLMQKQGGTHWRVGEWLALAVDGSRISVPRTKSNEDAFCAPNYGNSKAAKCKRKKKKKKKKTQGKRRRKPAKSPQPVKPQIWLTLIWHMGMQMPWSWRRGRSNSSEIDHFQSMLEEEQFPENTLFCADAGFRGYDLWKAIMDRGQSFLIRVGANVTLLKNLGHVRQRNDIVFFWPDAAARRRQPPLMLRLLEIKLGQTSAFVLTNVLDRKRLSLKQATELYKLRWGVELHFRAVKQTFSRRTLRCKTADRALVELDWSLLGLWFIQLHAAKEQIKVGSPPQNTSIALAVDVVRTIFKRHYLNPKPGDGLAAQLRGAVKDSYQRKSSKEARYKPNLKDKPSAGRPVVMNATEEQQNRLKAYPSTAS